MENAENKKIPIGIIAKENFKNWKENLGAGNLKGVVELYSDEKVSFWGTFARKRAKNLEEVKDYFVHFLQKKPVVVSEEEIDLIPISEDSYYHSGTYVFNVDAEKGGRKDVRARFDYVWKKNKNGQWKIAGHHSSIEPGGENR